MQAEAVVVEKVSLCRSTQILTIYTKCPGFNWGIFLIIYSSFESYVGNL